MADNIDRVRQIMAQAEDVDLPEGVVVGGQPAPDADDQIGDEHLDHPDDVSMPPRPPIKDGDPPPPEADCVKMPLNDLGNAMRFRRHCGGDVVNVPELGWHVWCGTHYKLDPHSLAVRSMAQQLGDLIAREIPYLTLDDWQMDAIGKEADLRQRLTDLCSQTGEDGKPTPDALSEMSDIDKRLRSIGDLKKQLGDKRKAHRNFARTAGNSGRIDAALKEYGPMRAIPQDQMDADPLAINTLSGVLRLSVDVAPETGSRTAAIRLDPHSREDHNTKVVDAHYIVGAKCPKFQAFLERVQPSEEMRLYLRRWLGLSLTGIRVQFMHFWYGDGANGKSVLIETIARLVGEYAADIRIETLTGNKQQSGAQATPDLLCMVGTRLFRSSEPGEGEPLQESLIKRITGGEALQVRANYGAFFPIYPKGKMTMSGNHKPDIRATDDGIWRRVKLVPWPVQIPEAERIPFEDMVSSLLEERDGILQWLVDGLFDYLECGMQEPATVCDATQEYREDSDPIGSFIASCCNCTGDNRDRIGARDLGQAFNFWLESKGEGRWSDRRVANRLKQKAGRWKSPRDGLGFDATKSHGIMTYTGLRFDSGFGPRFADAPRDHDGRPIVGRSPHGFGE